MRCAGPGPSTDFQSVLCAALGAAEVPSLWNRAAVITAISRSSWENWWSTFAFLHPAIQKSRVEEYLVH